jgi:hypothetical protein
MEDYSALRRKEILTNWMFEDTLQKKQASLEKTSCMIPQVRGP